MGHLYRRSRAPGRGRWGKGAGGREEGDKLGRGQTQILGKASTDDAKPNIPKAQLKRIRQSPTNYTRPKMTHEYFDKVQQY